jgi:OmpR-family two-component system manganese-sensing sensor histidine kinase
LNARLKLTVFYTAGVLAIIIVFSIAVFGLFVKNIGSDLEYEGEDNEAINIKLQVINKAQDQLQNILISIDGLIVILIAGLSYYLADKTLKPVEAAYWQQKKFVADAAHELRTPLSVMKTGAEVVLAGDEGKEEYKKLTLDSLEEINHLSVMVDDLLFLARSDNLRKVEFVKINFSQLVRKQIKFMASYAKKKRVMLKSEISDELYINGNESYLKRLLTNLVKNAIDYNKPDGEVSVFLDKNKNGIELKIVDSGIGISNDNLKHIFDRFYKVDQSHAKQSGGAGLGLSIAQEIVKSHKGLIQINSQLNNGTKILIFLPAS